MIEPGAYVALEAAYRIEARRVRATLIRLLGDFDAAEEALHEAFAAAADRWPKEGIPSNPYSWLVSAGRFKTIDRWRREMRLARALPALAPLAEPSLERDMPEVIEDDELRLIFTCCHPALPPDARIALTLREVAGLTTEEIARAYLVSPPTIGQRIVRAKAKIREAQIPYETPSPDDLPARLEPVLKVIYLVFNEGYAATEGDALTRPVFCAEALRLGRLVVGLLDEPEARGLLALMLLHDSRRAARVDAAGDLVLLEDQDRSLWDRNSISEAIGLITDAIAERKAGPYLLQALIAATHAEAESFDRTDWARAVSLYDALCQIEPSPVVALNRAAAIAMRDGPEAGLVAIDAVMTSGELDQYAYAHAARADVLRRLGCVDAARASYERALALTRQTAEQRFLRRRLANFGPTMRVV
ncbi:DNA-directed RNA polymerase sigma-70 factor [Aliidongia dinghuensis]|uniref:DNA-directed RNA polymerase sigma-70 factor n=1 Tax=Aliidongia dinghuensis TaxID=1867774 RepID=A0A8J2YT84_9PROT|nr:RNA polymerase sigma factor [Aliidongia dinghuensis]GGF12092.1 DNA-directed RNA polymerase sigma-70 factor [Aliidongia dinghuensis]